MITLAQILRDHQLNLQHHFGERMRPEHHAAIQSILACHTPDCGEVRYQCVPRQGKPTVGFTDGLGQLWPDERAAPKSGRNHL